MRCQIFWLQLKSPLHDRHDVKIKFFNDGFIRRFEAHRLPKGTVMVRQNEEGRGIYLILHGGAEVVRTEDDGTVVIASVEGEAAEKAIKMIEALTEMPEVGKTYNAKVKKITEFGAFVEILPGKEGLVHISQLDVNRVEKVEDMLKLGDMIDVKLMHIDDNGKMSLSRKALLPGGENAHEEMAKSRERRSSGGGDRGRGGRGGRPPRR